MNIEELIKDWETNEIIGGINCVLVIEQSSMKKFKQDLQSLINSAVEEEKKKRVGLIKDAIILAVKAERERIENAVELVIDSARNVNEKAANNIIYANTEYFGIGITLDRLEEEIAKAIGNK